MSITLTFVAWLLTSMQAHPCDAPNISSATVQSGAPVLMEWCQLPADNIDAITVYVGSTPRYLSPVTRVTSGTNSAGLALYRTGIGQFARGSYQIQVTAWNRNDQGVAQEGPPSTPFSLAVVDAIALPAAPRVKRVYR